MSHQPFNNSSLSEARLNANRQNAQHSTGPKSAEGKSVASQNATKLALTGRTVLLPTEDAARYESHVNGFFTDYQPFGTAETSLTQSIADVHWRIERIHSAEMAYYAKGRAILANNWDDEPADMRAAMIDLDIQQYYQREFRNLQIQEARLRRQRDRDVAELRFLQNERRRLIEERQDLAAHAYNQAKIEQKPFDPAALGFVFSTAEIETYIALRKAKRAIASERNQVFGVSFKRSKVA